MHFGLILMYFGVFAKVTSHFVPKLFRTQVIKYLFGHFVPTNYPFRAMSFRYPFGRLIWTKITNWFQMSKVVTKWRLCRPLALKSCHTILVISYLYFACFIPIYICSMEQNYFTMICLFCCGFTSPSTQFRSFWRRLVPLTTLFPDL